ncbi:MAG: ATP-dependent DNA helicase [bacterium]|nr:ATP-dependent DNA helicase [bacterium]
MGLNPEQKRIVELDITSSTKVLAGAGTGKTRVLVERYLKFVFEDGIAPDRILALTFTKKAAAEMYARIFESALERGDSEVMRGLYGAWIMNFHQFAFRMIKENAAALGVDPDIGVASEVDRLRLLRHIYRRLENGVLEGFPYVHEAGVPVPTSIRSHFEKDEKMMAKARGRLLVPENLLELVTDTDEPAYRQRVESIAAVWRNYERGLNERNLVDFDGMIRCAVMGIRRHSDLHHMYTGRFDHILVDEFQDTSEAQYEMLRLLAGDDFKRVTIVGDDKQSIYRWRDAQVENLRGFTGEPYYLKTNYRSTQGILDLAHGFIVGDPYFAAHAADIRLAANRGRSEAAISIFHPEDDSPKSFEAEARALAVWIQGLVGALPDAENPYPNARTNGTPLGYGDIAILMRSLKASAGFKEYERELNRLGIPYAVHGGVSALENQILELFKNVLTLLIYPGDLRAFLSAVEAPPLSVPDSVIQTIFDAAREVSGRNARASRQPTVAELLSQHTLGQISEEDVRRRLNMLADLVRDLDARREVLDLRTFIHDALEATHFYFHSFHEGADARFVDALTKVVVDVAEDLMRRRDGTLAAFVEALETLLEEGTLGDPDVAAHPEGRVRIMTVHLAKGLEFPAVALPGIKNRPRGGDSFVLLPDFGLFIGKKDYKNRSTEQAKKIVELTPGLTLPDRDQEERCLLYVAITRAKDYLFVSSPYANGVKPAKTPLPNLFAGVLNVLNDRDIYHEIARDVPATHCVVPASAGASEKEALEPLLERWRAGRERLEEARLHVTSVTGVQFAGWRGLLAFDRCPLQYRYQYIDGMIGWPETNADEESEPWERGTAKADHPAGIEPTLFGTFMHRFMYEWLSSTDREDVAELLNDLSARFGFSERREQVIAEGSRLIKAYRKSAIAGPVDERRLELPVQVRVDNVILRGVVDRVDGTNGGLRIVDYKGGSERDDYRFQVAFYAWALERTGDRVTSGVLCHLREPTALFEVDVSRGERIGKLAGHLSEAVLSNDFPPTPGEACRGCAFNCVCPHASRMAGA